VNARRRAAKQNKTIDERNAHQRRARKNVPVKERQEMNARRREHRKNLPPEERQELLALRNTRLTDKRNTPWAESIAMMCSYAGICIHSLTGIDINNKLYYILT
jgi:hemolysin activation/secretion protein